MQTVVIVVHLMIVLAMIGFVMLQRSEGGGLGMGSSGGGGFMSSRGTANALTRVTGFLAMAFFATSLTLSIIAGMERKPRSILQGGSTPASQPAPGAPATPLAPSGGGLLDALRGGPAAPSAPAAPEAPSGPQVPQSR
jgi:preprotein translocase subunit SecG